MCVTVHSCERVLCPGRCPERVTPAVDNMTHRSLSTASRINCGPFDVPKYKLLQIMVMDFCCCPRKKIFRVIFVDFSDFISLKKALSFWQKNTSLFFLPSLTLSHLSAVGLPEEKNIQSDFCRLFRFYFISFWQ